MLINLSFSTIYTFLDKIVRMIESEYIILYGDHFSRIPLYMYISFNRPHIKYKLLEWDSGKISFNH